jgi:hypothetical protein
MEECDDAAVRGRDAVGPEIGTTSSGSLKEIDFGSIEQFAIRS